MVMALRPSAALAGDPVCRNPLDVEFILDNSGSMGQASGGGTRLSEAIEAAQGFVNALDANGGVGDLHRVGLTSFNGTATGGDLELPIDDNADATTANGEIGSLTPSGNTPLRDGMLTGQADMTPFTRTFVDGVPVTHAYVLLSDGRPWVDALGVTRPTAGEITSYVGSVEQAYSILLGVSDNANPPTPNTLDPVLMGSLASNAGNFFQITDASQLGDIFGAIANDLLCGDIDLVKTVSPDSLPAGGGTVDYSFRLSNVGAQGSAPFTFVSLVDELNSIGSGIPGCSPVRGADDTGNNDALLEAGETWTFACNDVPISASTTNWACATMEYVNSDGATTTDCDDATVVVADAPPDEPGLTIVKDHLGPDTLPEDVGGNVTYTYDVTNTGNVALTSVEVEDHLDGTTTEACAVPASPMSGDTGSDGILGVGETWHYECTTAVTALGVTTNEACVTALVGQEVPIGDDPTICDTDSVTVPEGGEEGGTSTPTPTGSLTDTALSVPGAGGALATLVFGLLLVASLGTLAYVNVRASRERR
jgi:uncharacterized repeat protein (TIGR01451 family)